MSQRIYQKLDNPSQDQIIPQEGPTKPSDDNITENVREKKKYKKKTKVEVISEEKISKTKPSADGGLELSYTASKKILPKRELSEKQRASLAKLIENNKKRFAEYREEKTLSRDQQDRERAQKLVDDGKIEVNIRPRVKKPNPNHPLKRRDPLAPGTSPPPPPLETVQESQESPRSISVEKIAASADKIEIMIANIENKARSNKPTQPLRVVNPYTLMLQNARLRKNHRSGR